MLTHRAIPFVLRRLHRTTPRWGGQVLWVERTRRLGLVPTLASRLVAEFHRALFPGNGSHSVVRVFVGHVTTFYLVGFDSPKLDRRYFVGFDEYTTRVRNRLPMAAIRWLKYSFHE